MRCFVFRSVVAGFQFNFWACIERRRAATRRVELRAGSDDEALQEGAREGSIGDLEGRYKQ